MLVIEIMFIRNVEGDDNMIVFFYFSDIWFDFFNDFYWFMVDNVFLR